MSCEKFNQEIFESFGTNAISNELQAHLNSCSACKDIYDNLQSVSSGIGSDEMFYDSDETVAKRVEAVNNKIDELEMAEVVDVKSRWKSYVPMAAAIFLVLGIGLISKFFLQFDSTIQTADGPMEYVFVSLTDSDTEALAEVDFLELVDDFSVEFGIDNEMHLLDDISEEEYKYLEENLNIGEIL